MSLKKRKDGSYIARWYTNGRSGRQRQKNLGRISFAEATTEYKRLMASPDEKNVERKPEPLFREIAAEYLEFQGKKMKPKSLLRAKGVINGHLVPFIGDRVVSSLEPLDFDRYQQKRHDVEKASKATVNREWHVARAILNWAAKKKRAENPIARGAVEPYKLNNRGVKDFFFTPEEWRQFLAAFEDEEGFHKRVSDTRKNGPILGAVERFTGPRRFGGGRKAWSDASKRRFRAFRHTRGVFVALLYTGARLGEIVRLQWRQVDFRRSQIAIEQEKSGKPNVIPMGDALKAELAARQQGIGEAFVFTRESGAPYYLQEIQRAFATARSIAGVRSVLTPHSLRHTFGSWLAQEGFSLKTIQELLGHSDPSITAKHYAKLQPAGMLEAANRIAEVATSGHGGIGRKSG